MLTVDRRCDDRICVHKGIYRMVGSCFNCGTKDVLVLFTAGHETHKVDCPVCGCKHVQHFRLATEDEIPAA
jgi:hypothetical protein